MNLTLIVRFCVLLIASFSSTLFAATFVPDSLFFEHWRHYDSQGIECSVCHTTLSKGAYSLPDHQICESCHPPGKANDYIKTTGEICNKCHPMGNPDSSPLLSKIDRTQNRSFFHTAKIANLCENCHHAMLEATIPLGEVFTSQSERNRIRRKAHRFYTATQCQDCHSDGRSAAAKPANHTATWLQKEHTEVAPQFNCRICHSKSYCQGCHDSIY